MYFYSIILFCALILVWVANYYSYRKNRIGVYVLKGSIGFLCISTLLVNTILYLGTKEYAHAHIHAIFFGKILCNCVISVIAVVISTGLSHMLYCNLFSRSEKKKILFIETIFYLILSISVVMIIWGGELK